MICFPNCKINLGLYVTRKRDDGYHDIETVFYPLVRNSLSEGGLNDILEVVPAENTALHMSGLSVAGNSADNLVWKALHLLLYRYPDRVPPLDIYLHKIIPMGAGLGGGSADGAFMLRLLNDYCEVGLSDDELTTMALQLGSDCPFFIRNKPCFATGRGEQMTEISLGLSDYSIQLICPQLHVSTGAAFGMLTPAPPAFDLRQLGSLPLSDWKNYIRNDFELPVFSRHPVLAGIKEQLYQQGAVYAAMSGSGSAIYGIFPVGQKAAIQAPVSFESFYMGGV